MVDGKRPDMLAGTVVRFQLGDTKIITLYAIPGDEIPTCGLLVP